MLFEDIAKALQPQLIIHSDIAKYDESMIQNKFGKFITEDRVNGVFSVGNIEEFFDVDKIKDIQNKIQGTKGLVIVYGVASQVVCNPDILISGSISYQTIKDRYKQGLEIGAHNEDEEYLRKEKRFNFLESRVQDKHKERFIKNVIMLLIVIKMINLLWLQKMTLIRLYLNFSTSPFKPIPIFMKGVWGGHWCQKVLNAGKDLENTAWGITGFLDMQAVAAQLNNAVFEFPSTDLILCNPKEVLGRKIWYLYGNRCPLHVNFLDTWGGGNLSLQVHPTLAYAQEVFNSSWGHYESYYMLDACDESSVYLGTKDGVKLDDLVEAFETAQETGEFDDEKWINHFPMKKHDHVFIPGGTIHSAGKIH